MAGASATSVVGKAGELRVTSELLLRGHHPLVAAVDNGIDVKLDTGVTLQIKTCKVASAHSGGHYWVFTMHALRERGNGGKRVHRHNMVADFAVLWCVGSAFYIIPNAVLEGMHTVSIPVKIRRGTSKWEQYRERWDLLEEVTD